MKIAVEKTKMQHYVGDLNNQDSQLKKGELMRRKAIDSTLFSKTVWDESPKHEKHTPYSILLKKKKNTSVDKVPVQSKQLGAREKWMQTQ